MGRPADKDLLYNSEDADINLDNIEQVGSYALSFLWSDGHWHGIYAWQYLYDACQQDM